MLDNFEHLLDGGAARRRAARRRARAEGAGHQPGAAAAAGGARVPGAAARPARRARRRPPLEQLSQYEAVRLFVERAQAVKPDFAVDNDERPGGGRDLPAPGRAAAGDRAGGGAGAAAAAAGAAGPAGAAAAAADRRGARRPGPAADAARHDRLELRPARRRRSRRSSGAWPSSPAAAPWRRPRPSPTRTATLDVFDGLERLVEHSLLRQEEEPEGEPRFAMLETSASSRWSSWRRAAEAEAVRQPARGLLPGAGRRPAGAEAVRAAGSAVAGPAGGRARQPAGGPRLGPGAVLMPLSGWRPTWPGSGITAASSPKAVPGSIARWRLPRGRRLPRVPQRFSVPPRLPRSERHRSLRGDRR